MINVLFLIPCMGDGGIEAMIISWINALDFKQYHVDVFTQRITSVITKNKLESLGVRVYSSECRNRDIFIKRKFYKNILRKRKYSIVHLHTCFAPEFLLLKWSKDSGINIRIVHGHNALEHKKIKDTLIQRLSQPWMRHYATEYWGCTEEAAAEVVGNKGIKSKHYRKINNSIDTNRMRFSLTDREEIRNKLNLENKYVIGHIGRMTEQKNHLFLLDVFKECLKIKPNAILILIGDGELKNKIKVKAKQLNIEEKIIFIGITKEVPKYLSAMDHFLFPSLYEGFGIALLEAQCNGLSCTISSEMVQEAVLLDTTRSISLDKEKRIWAKSACINCRLSERVFAADIVKNSGYDINDNNLNKYYQKLLGS